MKKITQASFEEKVLANYGDRLVLENFTYDGYGSRGTVRCKKHGVYEASAQSLLKGYGCAVCYHESKVGKFKDTAESFIKKAKEKHGDKYIYDNIEYAGAKKKVSITCKKHGSFSQEAWTHLSGQGCPKCGDELIGLKSRLSQDEFLALATSAHGDKYDLSKTIYVSQNKPIAVICKTHGEFTPKAGNFLYNKSGCPKCAHELVGVRSRRSAQSYIEEALKIHNGEFAYGEIIYKNNQAYMTIICKEHGEFLQLAQDHLKGIGCQKCSKPVYDTESFIKEALLTHGETYDYTKSVYTSATDKVTIICKEHGEFNQIPSCHVSGEQGCPSCGSTGPSKGQREIYEFLKQHIECEMEHTLKDSRQRLDIFIPSLNLAIEHHGLIWHSTAFKVDPRADFKKHKIAATQGIRTIHIFQDEWAYKREIVASTLLSAIGKSDRIYAKQTEAIAVDKIVAREFFDRNHLQGAPLGSIYIGLQSDGNLVACMAFGVARSVRTNTDNGLWELQRYASTTTVVGGAGKLLKSFAKMNLCHTLISYSEERLFTGNMYEKLGFTLEHVTEPDYCYVTNTLKDGRQHKSNFQLRHLKDRFENFDADLSESENCKNNGFFQLFDCGKKKWSKAM